MCGFFGVIGKNLDKETAKIMLKSLEHRGPDNNALYFDENLCFGHSRLSINDLTPYSNQPFVSDNGILLYNGEIYNFKDLQKRTKIQNTDSDTEVLSSLLGNLGLRSLSLLNGMFSFGYWDKRNKSLIAARDRCGEKPFYYSLLSDGTLVFASEIKTIIKSKLINLNISEKQLRKYFENMHIDPGKSIYDNIKSLSPGEQLIFKNGIITKSFYWELKESTNKIEYLDAKSECNNLLELSVKRQLMANEEVGVLLSGGIDSSIIVSKAAKYNTKIKTFSFGFHERSELPFAKEISKIFNTDHYELYEEDLNISDLLIKMQNIYDDPISDSSCIPTYLINNFASKKLKVVLGGDGADEFFIGYSNWYNRLIELDVQSKKKMINYILENYLISQPIFRSKKRLLNIYNNSSNYIDMFRKLKSPFEEHHLTKLGLKSYKKSKKYKFEMNFEDIRRDCIEHYLPGNILVKSDRASMASSIELRSPFLDRDLIEFVYNLPVKYNYETNKTKKILKDILLEEGVPQKIVNRKKQGFGSPIDSWLKRKDIREMKKDYLLNKNSKIFNYIDYNQVNKDLNKNHQRDWSYLNLAIWFQERNKNF